MNTVDQNSALPFSKPSASGADSKPQRL